MYAKSAASMEIPFGAKGSVEMKGISPVVLSLREAQPSSDDNLRGFMSKTLVSIVMGSDSDLEILRESGKVPSRAGIGYEIDVTSAHRSRDRTSTSREVRRGICVIIAGAGGGASGWGDCTANKLLFLHCADSFDGATAGDGFFTFRPQMPHGDSGGYCCIGKPWGY